MRKQVKGWKDAPIVENNGTEVIEDKKPKWASAPVVDESVKKKDLTVSEVESQKQSSQPGLEESGAESKQPGEPSGKATESNQQPTEQGGSGLSEKILGTIFEGIATAGKQIYSGLTDIAPKSAAQAKEVLLSNLQSSTPEEFVKNKKSIEFQKYVREKEGMKWYQPFDIDKALKYAPEFVSEKYPDIKKSIEKNRPEAIQRRVELEKYVQEQNKESAKKLEGVPQSYKEIKSPKDAVKYAFNLGAQGLWQIPLTIITKGASGEMMEAAEVYDQQLDQLAKEHNISREEVIKKGLDKPAEGQLHAVAAAGLDLVSAGGLMNIVKKGGAPLLQKTIAAANEVITEPTQGMLEEMGGAKATSTTQKEAFKRAWSTNLSRRIDEAFGGLFGSQAVNLVTSTPQQTIEQAKSKITSTDDQATIKEEAGKIIESVSKPAPEEGVQNDSINKLGISSEVGKGTQLIEAKPVEGGGQKEAGASGVVSGSSPSSEESSQKEVTNEETKPEQTGEITGEQPVSETTAQETLPPQEQSKEGETKEFGIAFAPYREKNVTTEEEDQQVRESSDYKLHQENVQKIAEGLGIKVVDKSDTWGGYVDTETGKPVQEVSNVIHVEATPEKARLMAALLGQASPEMQDSVLLGNYHKEGTGTEFSFKFESPAKAQEALKLLQKNGLQYYTLNPKTGELTILDTDNSNLDKIRNFGLSLPENGIQAELQHNKVSAEFIGQKDYAGIIDKGIKHQGGEQNRFNPNAFVQEAKRKYDELKSGVAPPTSPPSPQTQEDFPEQGVRATIEKLQSESTLNGELKDAIEDFKNYEVKHRSTSQQKAKDYIDRVGEDQALSDATTFKVGRSIEEKIAVLSELANRFSSRYAQSGNVQDYDKFMMAMGDLSNNITDAAQALSYLNLVGEMFKTKQGAIRLATRQIEESREGALKNYEELKNNAKALIEAFDKLPREDFLKSERVKELLEQVSKPKSIKSKIAAKRVSSAADELKKAWNSLNTLGAIYDPKNQADKQINLEKALVKYIKEVIRKFVIDTGERLNDLVEPITKSVKSFVDEINLQISDEDLAPLIHNQIQEESTSQINKKYKGDINQALKDYVSRKSSLPELIEHIAESEELDSKDKQLLSDRLQKLFNDYSKKEKEKLVKRFLPKEKKKAKQRTEFYDKVIQLSNVGAVSDQQMNDALATIFGLPKMTPEIVTKIESMVDNINKAPEGRFKNIEITKLTDYIAQQQKFNVSNYLLASYRAGIFSGIDTQALNLTGNFINVLELGFLLSITNPKAGIRFIKSVKNPTSLSRAGLEALNMMKTGLDPRVAGDMKRRALEHSPRSFLGLGKPLEGWKQALDPTLEQQKKFVFRALSAGDLLFTYGINDALQNELYNDQASKLGLKGEERKAYIAEKMGFTPEKIETAGNQAITEAEYGQIPTDRISIALRTKEIIEQQRDPDIIEKSRAYAAGQIFTNSPTGYIGTIAKHINALIQDLPVVSAVIPVVNFSANAMSRGVQWLPPMAGIRGITKYGVRMSQGEKLSTIIKSDLDKLKSGDFELEMRLRRFAVSTVVTGILLGMLDDDDDGDNLLSKQLGKTVKIHGGGPGTALNRQKTYQKQETGYKPNSIQVGDTYIPFTNWPGLNVLLSTWGNYQDAIRYHKLGRKDAMERVAFALGNSTKVITEMGVLSSVNSLTSSLLEGQSKDIIDVSTKPVYGLFFPKFHRNIVGLFDDQVYSNQGFKELALRSLPIVNTYTNEPLLNALGEPIVKNWWDRTELWQSHGYSKNESLWKENAKNNYYIPVPSRWSLEKSFQHAVSSVEYNAYLKNRGEVIIKEFNSKKDALEKLPPEEYKAKMDRIIEFAGYRALVKLKVMETQIMKDIHYQLDDLQEIKRKQNKVMKGIKPKI